MGMEQKRNIRRRILDRVASDIFYIQNNIDRTNVRKLQRDLDNLDRYAYREIANLKVKMLWLALVISILSLADIVMAVTMIVS